MAATPIKASRPYLSSYINLLVAVIEIVVANVSALFERAMRCIVRSSRARTTHLELTIYVRFHLTIARDVANANDLEKWSDRDSENQQFASRVLRFLDVGTHRDLRVGHSIRLVIRKRHLDSPY